MSANSLTDSETLQPVLGGQPRYDLEAEMGLLGSVILDDSVISEIHTIIERDQFYQTNHQIIYEIMLKLYDAHTPIDLVTLKDELEKKGNGVFEKIGGLDYLTTLVESVSSPANAVYYARLIRDKYILRCIMQGCNEIMRAANQPTTETAGLLDTAQRIIFEIASKKEALKAIRIKDLLKDTVETHIMTVRDRRGHLSGLPSGIIELDNLLSGLQGGQLIVVAGRPGTGKSSFGLKLLEEGGLVENKPIIIFTLEVTRQQVVQNLLCSHSRVNGHSLRSGMISDEEIQRLLLSAGKFENTSIFIDDSSALTPFDLRTRARRLKADHDIQLVIVDYLQLMSMKGETDSREREIAMISYSLKSLAKELNIPVVAMAQLSRASEQKDRAGNKPRLADLRESGAIEQDADIVLLLYRESLINKTDQNERMCKIIVAKNRNGPVGDVDVSFLPEYTRFESLTKEQEE